MLITNVAKLSMVLWFEWLTLSDFGSESKTGMNGRHESKNKRTERLTSSDAFENRTFSDFLTLSEIGNF